MRELAETMVLGALLEELRKRWGGYTVLKHWQQGEFHHDLVIELPRHEGLPGKVLVVSINCNGGVKEVLCFAKVPERGGLWRMRCPEISEFSGTIPRVLAIARTSHWFDPCELLTPTARSELKEEFRERQFGGGWVPRMRSN